MNGSSATDVKARRGLPGYLLVLVCLICCAGMLCFATGCRASDALKEILYDQTAEIIDYDNEDKFYINDPQAEEESDKVSSDEASAVKVETERVQNIVVYSSTPNATQYNAKKSVWAEDPDFTGLEASETVTFYLTDDKSLKATLPQVLEEDEDYDDDDSETISVSSSSGTTGETGSGGSGESEEEGDLASEEGEEPEGQTGQGAGEAESEEAEITVINANDDFAELPTVDHIAAYGSYAVIVQVIGGEAALVAADAELLDEDGFQKVFADEGAADIVEAWDDDGESAEGLDVDALISSGAQVILAPSDDYLDDLSKKDRNKLIDAGVSLVAMPDLGNSTGITSAATAVGNMLADSTVIGQAGNTKANAKAYKNFHKQLVNACISANGGTVASYDSTIYEYSNTSSYTFDDGAAWTLLIDDWDTSVRMKNGALSMNGIGIATIGYATTPASYYIQVGGLINSAAAKAGKTYAGTYAVWQFYNNYQAYKDYFTYDEGGAFDESLTSTSTKRKGFAKDYFGDSFLCVVAGSSADIGNTKGGPPPSGFGTDSFPKVIAGTQRVKEKLIANSEAEDGAYHPYDLAEDDVGVYYGPSGSMAWGCIGASGDGSANVFLSAEDGNAITDESVCVNPHGLFASWTEYGSLEAVLEAAWVNDVVNDESSTVGWSDYVEEFYSTFYRYELSTSELATIEAGLEK